MSTNNASTRSDDGDTRSDDGDSNTSSSSFFSVALVVFLLGVFALVTLHHPLTTAYHGAKHWIKRGGLGGGGVGLPPNVGKPIIVIGMPKAGTSTIAEYFECGSVKTSHYFCAPEEVVDYCGLCIQRNIRAGMPRPLSACGDYDVFSQMDFTGGSQWRTGDPDSGACYFPQCEEEAMEAISAEFPSATFILNTRSVDDWIGSVNRWGDLRERLGTCNISGLPPGKGARGAVGDGELKAFIAAHAQKVQQFVRLHPSHALVEVVIDDPTAGEVMERAFNIPSRKCWRRANVNVAEDVNATATGTR